MRLRRRWVRLRPPVGCPTETLALYRHRFADGIVLLPLAEMLPTPAPCKFGLARSAAPSLGPARELIPNILTARPGALTVG